MVCEVGNRVLVVSPIQITLRIPKTLETVLKSGVLNRPCSHAKIIGHAVNIVSWAAQLLRGKLCTRSNGEQKQRNRKRLLMKWYRLNILYTMIYKKDLKKKKELTFLTSASFSFCCFCDLLFVISCFFLEAFSVVISR